MHSLLHSPRQRKRSIAAATLGALAILGSLLVATPAQALNDTGTGGVFVPATGRFLDTAKNIGGYDTAMPAKGWRTIQVTGKNGVPDDGSVGAVSVVATAASISNQGILYGRPNADAKSTLMGIYGGDDKQNTSFSAVLAVNSDGSQEKHLVALHRAGTHTTSEIAELFGVARSTVYRAIQRGGANPPAA